MGVGVGGERHSGRVAFPITGRARDEIRILDVPRGVLELAAVPALPASEPPAHVSFVGFGRPALATARRLNAAGAVVSWIGVPRSDLPDGDSARGPAGVSWSSWPNNGPTYLLDSSGAAVSASDVVLVGAPAAADGPHARLAEFGRACQIVAAAARPGQSIVVTTSCYVGSIADLLLRPLEERGIVPGRDVEVALCPAWRDVDGPDLAAVRRLGAEAARLGSAADADATGAGWSRAALDRSLETLEIEMLGAPPDRRLSLALKRALDFSAAAAGLLLLSPLFLLVALAILLDSGRPVLFRQVRAGPGGTTFKLAKFRTMVDGAEGRLEQVLGLNQIRGPGFQIEHDPRLTRLGGFLRRTSIDELPQLWNVLKGEMSLVGPRPAPLCEVTNYEPWHRRRLSVKPGITGLAQITARSYREFDQKASLDAEYIERWSLPLDLSILVHTIPLVLRMSGR